MNGAAIERGEAGLRVTGELTFATVPALWAESRPLLETGEGELELDLAAVARADSAGLALLIEWTRSARAAGRAVQFRNVPRQMREIARISSLDGILPFAS